MGVLLCCLKNNEDLIFQYSLNALTNSNSSSSLFNTMNESDYK